MRLTRKAGLLSVNRIPTLARLFETYGSSYNTSRNSSSKATLSLNVGNWGSYTEGWTCYCFFGCGSSLEITRLDFGSSAITRTQLSLTAASDSAKVATTVSGKTISSASTIYGGCMTVIHFNGTYDTDTIDYMFREAWKSSPKYYLSSTASSTATSATDTRIETSTVTGYGSGIILVMFRGSSTSWSVSTCVDPLTPIHAYIGGTVNRVALVEKTDSGTDYLYPSEDGLSIASTRGYTFKRLYEDW